MELATPEKYVPLGRAALEHVATGHPFVVAVNADV
jgi:hypothetical protein